MYKKSQAIKQPSLLIVIILLCLALAIVVGLIVSGGLKDLLRSDLI